MTIASRGWVLIDITTWKIYVRLDGHPRGASESQKVENGTRDKQRKGNLHEAGSSARAAIQGRIIILLLLWPLLHVTRLISYKVAQSSAGTGFFRRAHLARASRHRCQFRVTLPEYILERIFKGSFALDSHLALAPLQRP